MNTLAERAPAKVNLTLHVVGRREDGYHLLDSLAAFPAVGDVVRARPASSFSLAVGGPFGAALSGETDNLVLRAARALAASTGVPQAAALTLEKNLPVSSGIGGGSADAAACLRVLARLWNVAVPAGLAASLGADVPVCLAAHPARMGGIGEIVTAAPALPRCGIVLVNPGVAVATPPVFAARSGPFSTAAAIPDRWDDFTDFVAWLARGRNDLQSAAIGLCPPIANVLAALSAQPACAMARMSGSGATCFGLFAHETAAVAAAAALRRDDWWVWGGGLAEEPGLPSDPAQS